MTNSSSPISHGELRKIAADLKSGKIVFALGNAYPDYALGKEVAVMVSDLIESAISETRTVPQPQSHDEAQKRIGECVREIEMIADSFGYDPFEWLADSENGPNFNQERNAHADTIAAEHDSKPEDKQFDKEQKPPLPIEVMLGAFAVDALQENFDYLKRWADDVKIETYNGVPVVRLGFAPSAIGETPQMAVELGRLLNATALAKATLEYCFRQFRDSDKDCAPVLQALLVVTAALEPQPSYVNSLSKKE